jgi:hypothetical protein
MFTFEHQPADMHTRCVLSGYNDFYGAGVSARREREPITQRRVIPATALFCTYGRLSSPTFSTWMKCRTTVTQRRGGSRFMPVVVDGMLSLVSLI